MRVGQDVKPYTLTTCITWAWEKAARVRFLHESAELLIVTGLLQSTYDSDVDDVTCDVAACSVWSLHAESCQLLSPAAADADEWSSSRVTCEEPFGTFNDPVRLLNDSPAKW